VKDLLKHIAELKKQFAPLQPLSIENQQRLNKKFRLEWNFNSNHIEGNTLTYGETELLLIFDQTKGNHELREYEEMKGHDIALKLIYDLAADNERQLTEKFIREINEILLVRPFYKEAITPDGQQTRRQIKIGEYKSFPNSVLLQNGEIFHYPSPAETPAMMDDLMKWYNEASLNKNLQPVEVAAELHYKFVYIHPFDDGNGRIARLLMNFHLLKNNYPPVIIKTADKKKYLFALREADTGNIEAFKNYIAEQLVWSYEISIKAAQE
jgi:Fic family protein